MPGWSLQGPCVALPANHCLREQVLEPGAGSGPVGRGEGSLHRLGPHLGVCLPFTPHTHRLLLQRQLSQSVCPLWHLDTQDLQSLWLFCPNLPRLLSLKLRAWPMQLHSVSHEPGLAPVTSTVVQVRCRVSCIIFWFHSALPWQGRYTLLHRARLVCFCLGSILYIIL